MSHIKFENITRSVCIRYTRPGGGIGRRKGLKILEAISCRFDSGPGQMKNLLYITFICLLSSCGSIKAPSLVSPERANVPNSEGYGDYPSDYQSIVKNYLVSKLRSYRDTKVEFINTPNKLSIDHLGTTFSGYRLCLSLNEKQGEFYKGYKNHLILINNGEITLHLFDSGLLKIPFEYCVTRDESKVLFVDEIPDKKVIVDQDDVTIDSMDKVIIEDKNINNIYIICKYTSSEATYVFNETNKSFQEYDNMKKIT